jgi:hypothetical protein
LKKWQDPKQEVLPQVIEELFGEEGRKLESSSSSGSINPIDAEENVTLINQKVIEFKPNSNSNILQKTSNRITSVS